ncbi:DUF4623 domain-containing protein [Hoylesella loescheii]|uniref:DUF4623 domain-containing protein n=1 Tax=Hoylesella loescheii DSM 19665 = JCM 12249 = ATCC 15930 TaxID=1122985 RepID=A0A069QEQ2_HOYLO|nr:DUF4623 domain-containing protein [Hoylesella loescheii]KDR51270.1 hypothetical protein HMPREF1991_02634 [Hoylesella loescheii DSM 19665 = JCM 12249 = ATCC 15930]
MYKLKNIGLAAAVMMVATLVSCGDNYPASMDSPYDTDLLAIKILNAGEKGDQVVEGTVDEEKKEVNFPKLDTLTNFSALRLEAKLSDGAQLEKTEIDCKMAPDDEQKKLIIRVLNHNRYKDYFMTVRKHIPSWGAEFKNATVYSFAGDNRYEDFKTLDTRGADFDGQHVLVVTRTDNKPHLLKVADIKAGVINRIPLDLTGVSGGTFPYNMGALANGHIYMATLAIKTKSLLKVYYWETPTSTPEVIFSANLEDILESGKRYGDNMSLNIDKNGDGYIFFGENTAQNILRLTVSDHKNVSEPTILPADPKMKVSMNIYRYENTSDYLYSGLAMPITLSSNAAQKKFSLSAANQPAEAVAARAFMFNNKRYLITCAAGFGSASKATPTLYVYDISKGSNLAEALERFEAASQHEPVYSFILGGTGNSAPSPCTNFYIERDANGKDAKLYLFASRGESGFVIVEAPIAQDKD